MSSKLRFPAEAVILSYLEQHPITSIKNNTYLNEKNINEAVAKIFADKVLVPQGIIIGVQCCVYDLKLPSQSAKVIEYSLVKALIDCANNNLTSKL